MQTKKTINKAIFIFSFLCIGTVMIWYLIFQCTKDKALPKISEVTDYTDYTDEELYQITFGSPYSDVGKFLTQMSEQDRTAFLKYSPAVADAEVIHSYNTGRIVDGKKENQCYTEKMWQYAIKVYKKDRKLEKGQKQTQASVLYPLPHVEEKADISNTLKNFSVLNAKAVTWGDRVTITGKFRSTACSVYLGFFNGLQNEISAANMKDFNNKAVQTKLTWNLNKKDYYDSGGANDSAPVVNSITLQHCTNGATIAASGGVPLDLVNGMQILNFQPDSVNHLRKATQNTTNGSTAMSTFWSVGLASFQYQYTGAYLGYFPADGVYKLEFNHSNKGRFNYNTWGGWNANNTYNTANAKNTFNFNDEAGYTSAYSLANPAGAPPYMYWSNPNDITIQCNLATDSDGCEDKLADSPKAGSMGATSEDGSGQKRDHVEKGIQSTVATETLNLNPHGGTIYNTDHSIVSSDPVQITSGNVNQSVALNMHSWLGQDAVTMVRRLGYSVNKIFLRHNYIANESTTHAFGMLSDGAYTVKSIDYPASADKNSELSGTCYRIYSQNANETSLFASTGNRNLSDYMYTFLNDNPAIGSNPTSAIYYTWENDAPQIVVGGGYGYGTNYNANTVPDNDTMFYEGVEGYEDGEGNYRTANVYGVRYAASDALDMASAVHWALRNSGGYVLDAEDSENAACIHSVNAAIPAIQDYVPPISADTTGYRDYICITNASTSNALSVVKPITYHPIGQLDASDAQRIELTVMDWGGKTDKIILNVYVPCDGLNVPTPAPPAVPADPAQPADTSSTYHSGHLFQDSELRAICPSANAPDGFAYYTEELLPDTTVTIGTRMQLGTYRAIKRTSFTHTNPSNCTYYCYTCGGHPSTVDSTTIGGNYGVYCIYSVCPAGQNYLATCSNPVNVCPYCVNGNTFTKQFDTANNVTITNCAPVLETYEINTLPSDKSGLSYTTTKTENIMNNHVVTEADELSPLDITSLLITLADHEDTQIHYLEDPDKCNTNSVAPYCDVATFFKLTTIPKYDTSDYKDARTLTYTFTTTGNPNNATLTIDIGNLRLGRHNPGGLYPITFTLTDGDGATTTVTSTLYIDWVTPQLEVNGKVADNKLIYHTNQTIKQHDFFTDTVVTKAYDYMDTDAREPRLKDDGTLDEAVTSLFTGDAITSDLSEVRSNSLPKYIRIMETNELYVQTKAHPTTQSNDICRISDGKEGPLATNWRAANSIREEKTYEVKLRIFNPRNEAYYTDKTFEVKVVNDAPLIKAGKHLLVLYEEYTEDDIIDWWSTQAWDYEDGTLLSIPEASQNSEYASKTITSRDGTQRVCLGIDKNRKCLIPVESTNPVALRNNAETFHYRFKIIDWGTNNDYLYKVGDDNWANTFKEREYTLKIRFYDEDMAYADTTLTVIVRKTEAQMKGSLRFINKHFFFDDDGVSLRPAEEGGLAYDSIWRTNPEYREELARSLNTDVSNACAENNWEGCQYVFEFTPDDIKEAKALIKKHTVDAPPDERTWDFDDELWVIMNRCTLKRPTTDEEE